MIFALLDHHMLSAFDTEYVFKGYNDICLLTEMRAWARVGVEAGYQNSYALLERARRPQV